MNKLTRIAIACAVAFFNFTTAHADPVFNSRANAAQSAGGALAVGSSRAAHGSGGAIAGQRGLVADGEGNVAGGAAGGFTTESGGQGFRVRKFNRSDDGAITATGHRSASGANGNADRIGSFTRDADGTGSGDRSTTVTNANTGVTFNGSTTYTKGSGASRTTSCKDAAGNTIACFSR